MDRLNAVPTLIVVVGPIASGKSTIAEGLGERFRASGRLAAVLDLDEFVETIGGFAGLPGERCRQAQMVFGHWLPTRPPSEWIFDTTTTDAQAIADELAEALLS